MALHKNISYKELSEKWQSVRLVPYPLEGVNFNSFYEQLEQEDDGSDPLTNMTNRVLEKYSKKELWLMAI